MSEQEFRIEWTGNLKNYIPIKKQPEAENPKPCNIACGNRVPCWGCE